MFFSSIIDQIENLAIVNIKKGALNFESEGTFFYSDILIFYLYSFHALIGMASRSNLQIA